MVWPSQSLPPDDTVNQMKDAADGTGTQKMAAMVQDALAVPLQHLSTPQPHAATKENFKTRQHFAVVFVCKEWAYRYGTHLLSSKGTKGKQKDGEGREEDQTGNNSDLSRVGTEGGGGDTVRDICSVFSVGFCVILKQYSGFGMTADAIPSKTRLGWRPSCGMVMKSESKTSTRQEEKSGWRAPDGPNMTSALLLISGVVCMS
ncbi:hypothetical protein BaRGS_00023540 [Batillaria attramentaria]|uniref:Uncharacterized protein n=1 Tax=Batillaria attramentaria TaxID=370345 RepID=A0ABD0KDU5_9CAEN